MSLVSKKISIRLNFSCQIEKSQEDKKWGRLKMGKNEGDSIFLDIFLEKIKKWNRPRFYVPIFMLT